LGVPKGVADQQALGEMAAFLPHQKGFPGHASRFVGPSFGAMVGWAYWLKVSWQRVAAMTKLKSQYLFATPTQYTACAVVLNYWVPTSKVNNGVWIAIFIVGTGCLQLMPVRYFGEFEVSCATKVNSDADRQFWCSTFKIMTLTGLMLMALVVDLGGGPSGDRLGFRVGQWSY
jgi:amino acid transporter